MRFLESPCWEQQDQLIDWLSIVSVCRCVWVSLLMRIEDHLWRKSNLTPRYLALSLPFKQRERCLLFNSNLRFEKKVTPPASRNVIFVDNKRTDFCFLLFWFVTNIGLIRFFCLLVEKKKKTEKTGSKDRRNGLVFAVLFGRQFLSLSLSLFSLAISLDPARVFSQPDFSLVRVRVSKTTCR